MSTLDLIQKYPKASTVAAISAAIRAELVGGDDVVNATSALASLRHAWRRRGWTENLREIEAAYEAILVVHWGMRAEIRRRYGMPPESPDRDAPGR